MTTRKPIDIYDHLAHRESGEGVRRVARFLWTDTETGEELAVEVTGGEEFFAKLESLGFKRLAGDPRGSNRERRRARMNVWSAGGETAEHHRRRWA